MRGAEKTVLDELEGKLVEADQWGMGYDDWPTDHLRALIAVARAAKEKHERTGHCPFCEAGPPPHHNDGCALAALLQTFDQETR